MAVPVIASSNTSAFVASAASVVLTKPTGLAVGDLMLVAIVYCDSGSTNSVTPPGSWTSEETVNMADSFRRLSIFSKIADSSDVVASNFTFTHGTATSGGAILRITNVAVVGSHEQDYDDSSSTTSISYTSTLTPLYTDQLILMILGGWEASGSTTMSTYATTPSKTWTEVIDLGTTAGADPYLAIASATAGSLTQITSYSATLSVAKQAKGGVIMLITPPQNATGTNALFSISPAFFDENGRADTRGSNSLLQVSPTINTQNGAFNSPPVWLNPEKPANAVVVNPNK